VDGVVGVSDEPTTVVFETATLASAVGKAARVAPTKGAAYDKAAGIVLEIDPEAEHPVTVKSTNLEVTYLEWVNYLEIKGPPVTWRLPSILFSGLLSNLPIGSDAKVTLKHSDSDLIITSGKKRAKIRRMHDDLPYLQWQPFDSTAMLEVPEFSKRVAQVSWACDAESIPISGVHIAGDRIVATNRFRLAHVPCKVPVVEPITVPLDVLAPVLKNVVDARIEAQERRLHMMPDDYTQITATIFDADYLPWERITEMEVPQELTLTREEFREAIASMLVLVKTERYPLVRFIIGEGKIAIGMYVEGVGQIDDEIEVAGADHEPYEIHFTPQNVTEALAHAFSDTLTLSYNTGNPTSLVKFYDAKDDYEAWVVPRRVTAGGV
jgi:DNA polymerase III sliding clamp (beta) subunit (PCNA family)